MVLAMLLACSSVATYFAATTEEEPVAASTVDFGQQDNIQNGDLLKTDLVSKIYTTDSILHISDPKIQIIHKFRN